MATSRSAKSDSRYSMSGYSTGTWKECKSVLEFIDLAAQYTGSSSL